MNIQELTVDEWANALPDRGFEVFHLPEVLAVLADHSPGRLHLYGGFNGDNPIGLFPVFDQSRTVGRGLLSPAPAMGIHRLGPLVMPSSPKQRKREKVNQSFVRAVLDQIGARDSRTLFRTICPLSFDDPRPFEWEGFDVKIGFTYSLETHDITLEELSNSLSRSLRREIRDGHDLDISVNTGKEDAIREVFDQTRERYGEQDKEYRLNWKYVQDLTTTLMERDRCRCYVARTPDGEFLSGITVLYSNDAAYFWQGGARTIYDNVSINSLLHWHVIQDIVENPPIDSVTRYDLMGGNTERLCRYKSKFGATLVPYYIIESSGMQMQLAKRAYQMIAR